MGRLSGPARAWPLALGLIALAPAAEARAQAHMRVARPRAAAPSMGMGGNLGGAGARGGVGGYRGYNSGYGRGYGYGSGYGNPNRGRNAMANQNNGAVVVSLKSAATALTQADRDYQGHRAKALNHVGSAIRHLLPAAARRAQMNSGTGIGTGAGTLANANGAGAKAGAGVGAGTGAGKKNLMPQDVSDGHLRGALEALNGVHSRLTNYGNTPNHARALASVQNAIQELNQALTVR